jgi:undecaprenyl-diphosphatase
MPHPRHSPAVLVLLCCFILTATLVVSGVTLPGDEAILRAAGGMRTDWLTSVMRFFTLLGNGKVEIPLALLLVGYFWWKGEQPTARRYFLACVSGELVYAVAKALFGRPRPQVIERLSDAGWSSFPSGHATLAPVIYTLGLVLLSRSINAGSSRPVLLGLGIVFPVVIAVSRVYLGVHYPSDVVAGLFLGSAWALLWDGRRSSASASAASSAPATR